MCHTHTQICVHTHPPLSQVVGCESPPSSGCAGLSARAPLLWETRVPPAPSDPRGPITACHTLGYEFQGCPRGGHGGVAGGCWGHPWGGGWHRPAPAEPLAPWGHVRQGHTSPDSRDFHSRVSPPVKCYGFFHTSFQAGSFCFKNIAVISWLLLNLADVPPSSFLGSLGANIPLAVWVTVCLHLHLYLSSHCHLGHLPRVGCPSSLTLVS